MEWPKIGTSWVIGNYGFSIWTGSTIGWTSCDASITTTTSCLDFVISTTCSTSLTSSTWMLSITWSKH
jgi:hypothetical protein